MKKDRFEKARRPVVEPVTKSTPDAPTHETQTTHPAFGQIAAARVSGAAYLYGSDFRHQHFIHLTIRESVEYRSLSNDWRHGTKEIIQVAMSEAQWARLVSSLNVGAGADCTLEYVEGRGEIPYLPKPKAKTDTFHAEMKRRVAQSVASLKEARELIEAGKGRGTALRLLDSALSGLDVSAKFIADQFGEHMEDVVEGAKAEVDAYMQARLTRDALPASVSAPLVIDTKPEPPAFGGA